MKKIIKSLVIASSVAAVIGVGTVSFAAWSGSSPRVGTTGANGTLLTTGFVSDTATAWTGSLVPYDQIEGSYVSGGVKFASITLPAIKAGTNKKIMVAAALKESAAADAAAVTGLSNTTLWVKCDNAAVSAVTGILTADGVAAENTVKSLSSTAVEVKAAPGGSGYASDTTLVLSFAMSSTENNAAGKVWHITVTLE